MSRICRGVLSAILLLRGKGIVICDNDCGTIYCLCAIYYPKNDIANQYITSCGTAPFGTEYYHLNGKSIEGHNPECGVESEGEDEFVS